MLYNWGVFLVRDGPGYITSKITILAISEINMELGTFCTVFTVPKFQSYI